MAAEVPDQEIIMDSVIRADRHLVTMADQVKIITDQGSQTETTTTTIMEMVVRVSQTELMEMADLAIQAVRITTMAMAGLMG
jgi:hypothetical protein